MPQYTVEAFRWSGTGYNALYNTSYTAVLDDDDPDYEGGADGNESISINGGAFGATASQPYVIVISFTDTSGTPQVEEFYFFNTGGAWYFVPAPGSAFTVGATLGSFQSFTVGWEYADVTCFVTGTLIETAKGPCPVEDLRSGDLVKVADGSFEPVRLVLSRTISASELEDAPKLRPVRISAHSLGEFLPKRDLLVSRQHRMVCNTAISKRMFGKDCVFVAAARLLDVPGVYVDKDLTEVGYHHIIFDDHQVVYAEGALSESFLVCENTLSTLSDAAYDELLAILPDIAETGYQQRLAIAQPDRKKQKNLVRRHLKNKKPLLSQAF